MKIGMSISNYGTRLRYDGIDLLTPIDPSQMSLVIMIMLREFIKHQIGNYH